MSSILTQLLPPDTGSSAQTAIWTDPKGCIIATEDDSDCPVCPSENGGCGEGRTYTSPLGSPLSSSINVDDATQSGIHFVPGVYYSDCTTFTSQNFSSGVGCCGDSLSAPIPCFDSSGHIFCSEYGQSVTIHVTRTFVFDIDKLQLILIGLEQVDDIGYVGGIKLNECSGFSSFPDFPLDVTSQVTIGGNIASFQIRAADVACNENLFKNFSFRWIYRLQE